MNIVELIGGGALWMAIPVAMLAGLISFVSPCVLPLVPGYLGFIGGAVAPREQKAVDELGTGGTTATATRTVAPSRSRLVLGVLLFISGFTVVFLAMTVLGGSLGLFFLEYSDVITRILGVVVIVLGLVFLGAFRIFQQTRRPSITNRFGLAGAPLLGVVMGVGWAPCIGPTLGTIIALSWNVGDPWRAGVLGVAYSLGLGLPFLLLALGFGWATSAVGFIRRHIRVVNYIGGGMLIIVGLLMVTGVWTMWMAALGAQMATIEMPL